MEEKKNGGARPGAGRKSKVEEEKVNVIFLTALKRLYDVDSDEDAKIKFIQDTLLVSQRGQIFVAEHLFGKAKEKLEHDVNINNFKLKDVVSFDKTQQ